MLFQSLFDRNIFKAALLASFCVHLVIYVSASRILPEKVVKTEPESVKVRLAEPPAPRVVSTPVAQPTIKPTPRPLFQYPHNSFHFFMPLGALQALLHVLHHSIENRLLAQNRLTT